MTVYKAVNISLSPFGYNRERKRSDFVATARASLTKKLIPGILFGVIVLVAISLLGDMRQVSESILDFDWRIFPLAILLTLFNYTLRFYKWHYYLGQIGAKSIRAGKSLRMFVAGFPLAVTPGKAGEVLKGVWIKHASSSTPVGKGVAVVAAERISDGLAVLILSILGVVAYRQYWPVFALVMAALLAVIVISQIRPLAEALLNWGEKLPFVSRYVHNLHEFYEGSFALFRPAATITAVSLGTVSWLGEGIGFYLILLGLGVAAGWNTLAMAVFILAFSTIVGAASALPGGLGAAEVSIAGMLKLLLKVEPSTAAAATLLIRLATLWFGVGLGLLAWTISPDLLGLRVENERMVES
jgi:glycosyltransferase 2 family protein